MGAFAETLGASEHHASALLACALGTRLPITNRPRANRRLLVAVRRCFRSGPTTRTSRGGRTRPIILHRHSRQAQSASSVSSGVHSCLGSHSDVAYLLARHLTPRSTATPRSIALRRG